MLKFERVDDKGLKVIILFRNPDITKVIISYFIKVYQSILEQLLPFSRLIYSHE